MQKALSLRTLSLALFGLAGFFGPARMAAAAPPVAVASPAKTADRLTISDFKDTADLARFAHRGIADDHFTRIEGGGVRIDFVPYVAGGEQWPAVILRPEKGLPKDWSLYDVLAVDVHNSAAGEMLLYYQVDDQQGYKTIVPYHIAPGTTQTLRLPLSELGLVDPFQIRQLQIFTTRPPAEMVAEVRHWRLETDDALHRALLGKVINDTHALFARLQKETKDPTALAFLREQQMHSQRMEDRLHVSQDRAEQNRLRLDLMALTGLLEERTRRVASESGLRREFARIAPKSTYAVGFANSMEKVFPVDRPFQAVASRTGSLALAGNEKESLQLLVLAGKSELKDVQVKAGTLTRADGKATLPASAITVAPVGFVQTKRPDYVVSYVGWYPDPLLDFLDKVTVKAGEMQSFWVRVAAPAHTPPGVYSGTITVRPANAAPVTLTLSVTVWGFDLTPETHLRTAVSLSEFMLHKVYGDVPEALRQRYYSFLLENRLNADNIYRTAPPEIADLQLWNRQGLNAFNITYVPRPANLKPGGLYPPEYKQLILARLDNIIPKLKAAGLYSKAYVYGFDEVRPETFNAIRDIMSAIREKYPDLLILTTAYDATYGEQSKLPTSVVNGWVPLTPKYDPARAEAARKQGKQVWWYTCIAPQAPFANWLVEYDAIDARSLMGLQTAKYRPDGYLYYALNRWPLSTKPITFGPYTDWPPASFNTSNGDGSVICAGPNGPLSTIRFENIRDGIEDNEYFWLLREEIRKLKASTNPGAVAALRQAQQAETIGPELVSDLTHFSKSPDALYAKRRQVAEAILAARKVTQARR